ncbi:enolase C-terminal domain-like protein [Kitasatospora sp. NPDC006697]|uniref:enolase C-terminal domain-like protein n=1 Tax=Kitasatospora sp. NPDC006697 TaxID=3364020 RepID=UPI00369A85DB
MTTAVAPNTTLTQHAELYRSAVGGRTEWLLLKLTDADGVTGWGECSDAGPLPAVLRALDNGDADPFTCRTVRGAIRQAQADQAARRAGQPLWQWLGGRELPGPVPLTALLDRAARAGADHRAPATAARAAAQAVEAGFRSLRFAPFDSAGGDRLAHLGLARVAAVQAAAAGAAELLVDCHRRLPLRELTGLLEPFARLGVARLEDGVRADRPAELAELRRRTAIPLAVRRFTARPGELAAAAGLLDLVLTDVKHAGGPAAVLELAAGAAGPVPRVALRNPAGPVATLHSAHLAAVLPGAEPLEYAFGEVPWRASLLRAGERVADGRLAIPAGPGLGDEPDPRHPSLVPVWRGLLADPCCAGS